MQAHSKCTHTTPVLPDYFWSFQCLVVFPAISKLAWHNSILVRSILHNIGVVLWSNAVRLSVFPLRCVSIVWQLTLVSVAQVSPSPYYFSRTGPFFHSRAKNAIKQRTDSRDTHPVKLCMPAPTVDRNEPIRITHLVGGQAISATTMTLSILRPNLQKSRVTHSLLTISLSFPSSHEWFSNSMNPWPTRLNRQNRFCPTESRSQ